MTIKGFRSSVEALKASKRVNANPRAIELRDGTWLGLGEENIGRDGEHSQLVYGQRGTTAVYASVRDSVV